MKWEKHYSHAWAVQWEKGVNKSWVHGNKRRRSKHTSQQPSSRLNTYKRSASRYGEVMGLGMSRCQAQVVKHYRPIYTHTPASHPHLQGTCRQRPRWPFKQIYTGHRKPSIWQVLRELPRLICTDRFYFSTFAGFSLLSDHPPWWAIFAPLQTNDLWNLSRQMPGPPSYSTSYDPTQGPSSSILRLWDNDALERKEKNRGVLNTGNVHAWRLLCTMPDACMWK